MLEQHGGFHRPSYVVMRMHQFLEFEEKMHTNQHIFMIYYHIISYYYDIFTRFLFSIKSPLKKAEPDKTNGNS